MVLLFIVFFFSSRRRHTRSTRDWSSDVCSSDLAFAGSIQYGALKDALERGYAAASTDTRSEERREGKSVDLGGSRISKKKKREREKKYKKRKYHSQMRRKWRNECSSETRALRAC